VRLGSHMQASALELFANLAQWSEIEALKYLVKFKYLPLLSDSFEYCPQQVARVLCNFLLCPEFEGRYHSLRHIIA
jgi:hypothetical protein